MSLPSTCLADSFTKPLTKDRCMDHATLVWDFVLPFLRTQPCYRAPTASPYPYNQPNGNSLNVMLATTYFLQNDGLLGSYCIFFPCFFFFSVNSELGESVSFFCIYISRAICLLPIAPALTTVPDISFTGNMRFSQLLPHIFPTRAWLMFAFLRVFIFSNLTPVFDQRRMFVFLIHLSHSLFICSPCTTITPIL